MNEDDIGIDSPDGGAGITCNVRANSNTRRIQRSTRASAEPGSTIRVSISFNSERGGKNSARILAYIDPITGKGIVRMGMFDTSSSAIGKEVGKQLVWETERPVWKGK